MRSRHFAVLAAAIVMAACGCWRERTPDYPKWRDRLELFANVEKLAVAPVRENGRIEWPREFGAEQFAVIFADEVTRRARFKVIYPRNLLAAVEDSNRETMLLCQKESRPPTDGEIINLERSEEDVVAAGRAAGADAVLVITVNDFEVYPPKRLALGVRVYLCATPTREALDVIRMSEAGVPLEVPTALRDKFIWERQKHYDSLRKNTQTGMEWYARKHGGNTGFGEELFPNSTDRFLRFVADDLTAILCDDANSYKRRAWFGLGPKPAAPDPARGARPNDEKGASGFELGHGEHGVRK